LLKNLYYQGKENRIMSFNTQYMVRFKNPRDQQQIAVLARQMYPHNSDRMLQIYKEATQEPYGYLLVDLKPETHESERLKTDIFKHSYTKDTPNLTDMATEIYQPRQVQNSSPYIIHTNSYTKDVPKLTDMATDIYPPREMQNPSQHIIHPELREMRPHQNLIQPTEQYDFETHRHPKSIMLESKPNPNLEQAIMDRNSIFEEEKPVCKACHLVFDSHEGIFMHRVWCRKLKLEEDELNALFNMVEEAME
jgi:hypothetical protein